MTIEDEDGQKIGSVASVAEQLGCHRNTLNRVINGSASVTPEMALALEKIACRKRRILAIHANQL